MANKRVRMPNSIKPGDCIGITAPSFGASIEPYSVYIDIGEKILRDRGYKITEGRTARLGDGKGISTDPKVAAAELVEFYKSESIDAIISAGGGELMNETITNIDFDDLKSARPKWFVGYSDNTNFIFPMVTIADTCGIYGPCINGYAKEWEDTEKDVFAILEGTKKDFAGYDQFEREEPSKGPEEYNYDVLYRYNLNTKKELSNYDCAEGIAKKSGEDKSFKMNGILLGGCLDVLANLVGTRFDRVKEFKKNHEDIIWVLEACDFNVMSYRRAIWNLREAGWFDNARGFIIGRPLSCHGEVFTGVDEYNAVTDVLECFKVPIIMDADIGHIDPMLPVIMGAEAEVKVRGNDLRIEYK